MKTFRRIVASFLFVAVIGETFSSAAFADKLVVDSPIKCAELIKECFSYGEDQREQCFGTSASHTFCAGIELGSLARQRWQLSPVIPHGIDASGLVGPQLVDRQCLNNFDNQMSGALVKGEISEQSVRILAVALENCKIKPTNELLRP